MSVLRHNRVYILTCFVLGRCISEILWNNMECFNNEVTDLTGDWFEWKIDLLPFNIGVVSKRYAEKLVMAVIIGQRWKSCLREVI